MLRTITFGDNCRDDVDQKIRVITKGLVGLLVDVHDDSRHPHEPSTSLVRSGMVFGADDEHLTLSPNDTPPGDVMLIPWDAMTELVIW